MLYLRGNDYGGRALSERNWVDSFTYAVRFDLTVKAIVTNGYDVPLFVAESDAYVTVITRFNVVFASGLGPNYWRVGLRFGQADLPDQARDTDFLDTEIPVTVGRLLTNGFVGPVMQSEVRETAYVARPDRLVGCRFSPLHFPHWNAAMNPVGTAYIAGGRLQ